MKLTNSPFKSDATNLNRLYRNNRTSSLRLFLRLGVIIMLAGLLASGFYWSSAASTSSKAVSNNKSAVARATITTSSTADLVGSRPFGFVSMLTPVPQAAPTVAIYASDCTTGKTVFNLQDADKTVCAKVTGAQPFWRILWSNADFNTVQNVPVGSGESTFTLTAASSLGDWRVILFDPFGGTVQGVTTFTVIDAENPSADLLISKGLISNSLSAGGQAVFVVQVQSQGPSDASAVVLSDDVPANTSFVSFNQLSGPVFECTSTTGSTVCTIASLARGDEATFVATYQVGAVSSGTVISNTATISSTTPDPNAGSNSSTAEGSVVGSPCQISTPGNITTSADAGQSGAVVTYATPGHSGDCGQPATGENGETIPVISCNPASGSFFPAGSTTVICVAQVGDVVTFQVTVNNPGGGLAISLNGANPFALECGADFADPGATAVNGVGNPVPVVVTGTLDNHTPASYTLTYTATEGANSVSTERIVIVSDNEAPVISLDGANPITISSGSAFVDPGASANDDCEGPIGVTSSGAPSNPAAAGTYTITYTASDSENHTATATRTVIVQGNGSGAPTITIDGGTPLNIECGSTFSDPGATATTSDGTSVPVTSTGADLVDSDTPGSYIITYTACIEDSPGHCDPARTSTAERTVIVQDTTAPTIEILGANPLQVECHSAFIDPGATAHDVCSGDFAATASGTVDFNTVGEYTITYEATDPSGNLGDPVTRTVNVVDTTAPTITLNGANPMTVECHTSFTDPGAIAHDACAGDFAATALGSVDANTVGTYTITYNATDPSGFAATPVTRTVNVVDTTDPVVTPPANVTVNTGSGNTSCTVTVSDATLGTASATDSCQGDLSVTRTGVPAGNVFPVGTTTITYSATDASNNTGTATQTVTVTDNTAPTITTNGQTLSMWPPNHKYKTFQVTQFVTGASDNCDSGIGVNSVVIDHVTSDETENGGGDGNTLNDIVIAADCKSVQLRAERNGGGNGRVYTITFRVTDAANNTTTATAKVVVPHNNGGTAVDSGVHYSVNGCP